MDGDAEADEVADGEVETVGRTVGGGIIQVPVAAEPVVDDEEEEEEAGGKTSHTKPEAQRQEVWPSRLLFAFAAEKLPETPHASHACCVGPLVEMPATEKVPGPHGEQTTSETSVPAAAKYVPAGHVLFHAPQLAELLAAANVPEAHAAQSASAVADAGAKAKEPGAHTVAAKGHAASGRLPFAPDESEAAGWKVPARQGSHFRSAVVFAAAL